MRKYTQTSPEAGARVVALALIADGAIDRCEILRIMLDIVNADHGQTASEASLIALPLERRNIALCGMTEPSIPRHCLPSETPIHRGSAVSRRGGDHVATR